jgi:hypothetical protein
VFIPFPIWKKPLLKNSSFTRIRPFQKDESVGFACTADKVLCLKYLLRSSSCHTPSSLSNLKSHLLSKHLFLSSRTSTPKPPWSLGRQTIFHFVRRYFFLFSSDCQKNLDL